MALGTLGLLVIGAIPTTIGVCEAISAQKKQNAAMKETAKFHLTAKLPLEGYPPAEAMVVLKDGKLWIDHQTAPVEGHKFTGYYFTYPSEEQHKGLVSTISDDPPMLNWIFGDKDTGMMRYAGRKETIGHRIGPWGWTVDETYLTLDGDPDCFIAVQDPENKKWSVSILMGRRDRDRGPDHRSAAGGPVGQKQVHQQRRRQPYADDGDDDQSGEEHSEYDDEEGYDDATDAGEDEPEEEEEGDEEDEDEEGRGGRGRLMIRLRRRMMLGMDSSYVRN